MTRAIRAMVMTLVLAFGACAAPGQVVYGPPAPGTPLASALSSGPTQMSPASIMGPNVNPIEVLAGAGEAFNGQRTNGQDVPARSGLSTVVNIMVVLTVISLAPSIMLMTTCFTRILIVLGLLKQAIGAQSIPPPQVTTGLAMFMTLLVMAPTFDRINNEAIAPYRAGQITTYDQLWDKARQPMRDFMFDQIEATGNWSSLYMVMERRGIDVSQPEKLTRANVDMISLVPAFMLSELKTSFLMGFRLYLPFLVIDLVISTMLIAMGMMMLPPVLISLPFKLLLFVLVDGWALIVGSLMDSFAHGGTVASSGHAAVGVLSVWLG